MSTSVNEIRPLDQQQWFEKFLSIPKYCKIADQHQHVISSYKEMTLLKAILHDTVYENGRKFLNLYNILDIVPYYYIDYILENNPESILDLGCGLNVFKNFIPGIVGMDADPNSPADIKDFFDQDYVLGHQHKYDALISINTIHFAPVDTITQRLLWASKLICSGGKGFVSFNLETWLMHTSPDTVKKLFGPVPVFDNVINFVNDQIVNTKLDFLVVDWPVLHITEHSTIRDDLNGNIRLVFET